jgi:hypothetical protein
MLEAFLVNNPIPPVLLWMIVYISDYFWTIRAARLYQEGANRHFSFGGGIELTPYYQKDVERLNLVSLRFVLMLILTSGLILAIWVLAVPLVKLPTLFSFALGALVLVEAVVHARHFRNIFLFQKARDNQGITGKIEYERWLVLQTSSVEFFSSAIIYLFAFFVSGSWFFAGGAAGSFSMGMRHWRWGGRAVSVNCFL